MIDDGICKGIKAVRRNEDGSGETEELEIYGENAILASGGIGGLYRHSTNFPHLTGDAIELAKKYGIRLEHLDYVQIRSDDTVFDEAGTAFSDFRISSGRGRGAL